MNWKAHADEISRLISFLDLLSLIIYDNRMKAEGISSQIKAMRLKLGLSLSELARRVNTSPATICRYENGWDRFEIYTLKKIASALGCRLNIHFVKLKSQQTPKSADAAVRRLRRLFWDHHLTKSDLFCHPVWVVGRVIEYGSLEDVLTLASMYGRQVFLDYVAKCRFQSSKTAAFWRTMLKKEGGHL